MVLCRETELFQEVVWYAVGTQAFPVQDFAKDHFQFGWREGRTNACLLSLAAARGHGCSDPQFDHIVHSLVLGMLDTPA